MLIRVPEAHSRSFVKAVSWRVVGSLDTFLITWIVTGQLKYAGIILGVETFTKVGIYYLHEQFWAWVPWWRSDKTVAALAGQATPVQPVSIEKAPPAAA